jgi:hypothetical protein
MATYKDFSYEKRPDGSWSLIFPGGGKLRTPKQSEDDLKKEIDAIIANVPAGEAP